MTFWKNTFSFQNLCNNQILTELQRENHNYFESKSSGIDFYTFYYIAILT